MAVLVLLVVAENAKCQEIKFTARPLVAPQWGRAEREGGEGGREREKEEGSEANLGSPFRAKSWGYSAFQYILPDLTPKTNRCASRFATTAEARSRPRAESATFQCCVLFATLIEIGRK